MCGDKFLSAQMVWRRRQTLSTFVHALEGSRVVVELRYDTIIRGLLQQVHCLAVESWATPLSTSARVVHCGLP